MSRGRSQKLKLIYILDIFKKYSDEEHPLNSSDIIEKLADFSIECERKAIYNDIALLEEYGCDIVKTSTPKKGWFLAGGDFELPEIYLLCDAVKSAKFISAKKTRELLKKLRGMISIYSAERNKKAVYFAHAEKCENEEIYYNIDTISSAIEKGKQIEFTYTMRTLGSSREVTLKEKQMRINPYALTWQDDYYYLIGNHVKYDNLIHLRLDRISKVKITGTKARSYCEVSDYTDFFDTADYTSKLFGMYSGKMQKIEFCCNTNIAEQVLDRFGENIFIKNLSNNEFKFTVEAAVSDALVTWIINYGENLRVEKPESLREMVISRANAVLHNYSKNG